MKNKFQETPLHLALRSNHLKIAQVLIDKGANVNAEGAGKETSLNLAIEFGYLKIAQVLIKNKASLSEKNSSQETPLHLAAESGNFEIAQILINNEANLNAKNSNQQTPLHLAIKSGNFKIAQVLIEKVTNVNVEGNFKETPLHLAVKSGNFGISKVLVSSGADVRAKNKDKLTPLYIARKSGNVDVFRLINYRNKEVLKLTKNKVYVDKVSPVNMKNLNVIGGKSQNIINKRTISESEDSYRNSDNRKENIEVKDKSSIEMIAVNALIEMGNGGKPATEAPRLPSNSTLPDSTRDINVIGGKALNINNKRTRNDGGHSDSDSNKKPKAITKKGPK